MPVYIYKHTFLCLDVYWCFYSHVSIGRLSRAIGLNHLPVYEFSVYVCVIDFMHQYVYFLVFIC